MLLAPLLTCFCLFICYQTCFYVFIFTIYFLTFDLRTCWRTDAVVSTSCVSVTRPLCFHTLPLSTLSTQSPCCSSSSSRRSRLQVRRQDGDQRQPGADHRGNQRGRGGPADGQLWEDADWHHAGEGRPAGADAVTSARRSHCTSSVLLFFPPPPGQPRPVTPVASPQFSCERPGSLWMFCVFVCF